MVEISCNNNMGMEDAMKRTAELDSSCLKRAEYDDVRRTLTLTFTSGRVYEYAGVPADVFEMLISAGSIGKKFNSLIRNRFAYRELG